MCEVSAGGARLRRWRSQCTDRSSGAHTLRLRVPSEKTKIHIATITFRLEDSAALSNAASQFSSLKRSEIKSSTFTSRVAKT
jgi:hypothetical protein